MTRPNLLLLTIDCLRYDSCGFNGYDRPTTPNLDRLANTATIFDNAYATGPWTAESFPGIMSGRLSRDTAYYEQISWKAIPNDAPTLASWLHENDYNTMARVSNPHLSKYRNFDRGFDSFENLRINRLGEKFTADRAAGDSPSSKTKIIASLRSTMRHLKKYDIPLSHTMPVVAYRLNQLSGQWPTIAAEDVIGELITALDSTDQPFFAWAHLMDLHAPIHPERASEGGLLSSDSTIRQFVWDANRLVNEYEPHYRDMYDSTLRYIDQQIGQLIKWLKANNEWDNTIIIVTSDHGEALHDRGIYGHAAGRDKFEFESDRHYMYDELLHVPLLAKSTQDNPKRLNHLFSLGWLHELIADLLDITPVDMPLSTDRESHLNEGTDEIIQSDVISGESQTIAVRDDERKIITQKIDNGVLDLDAAKVYAPKFDRREQYPLEEEPSPKLVKAIEQINLQEKLPQLSGELSADTEELLEDLGYR
ncbi:sulfatase-like hydrolase/transferase [Haladaptatus pallidirubidus]|uniref:Sulfatase-like hydrolase/transferase n=1 Tax=Haladaptatus pallidirubidus TaxID=1008152 RepID=A0AAV3UHY4_9EURY|nr:sulfatase [Haladaptatus pallidirubidus]